MDCRRFRDELNRARAGALPDEIRRHAEACERCRVELRAARLLSLGSGPAEGAPRPGFSQRLQVRLEAEGSRLPAGWADAIGLAARPAFGLAAAAALVSIGLYTAIPNAAPRDDLALLVESDPIIGSLFVESPAGLLAPLETER